MSGEGASTSAPVASTSSQSVFAQYDQQHANRPPTSDDEDDDDGYGFSDSEGDSDEDFARANRVAGRAVRSVQVPGMYSADQVLPDEESGSKTVLGTTASHGTRSRRSLTIPWPCRDLPDDQSGSHRPLAAVPARGRRTSLARSCTSLALTLIHRRFLRTQWNADYASGLIDSLLRNMHIPEVLFNLYTPAPDSPQFRRISPALQVDARHEGALPAKWLRKLKHELDAPSDDEDDEEDARRQQKVPLELWSCADGKQRMTSLVRCVASGRPFAVAPALTLERAQLHRRRLSGRACSLVASLPSDLHADGCVPSSPHSAEGRQEED